MYFKIANKNILYKKNFIITILNIKGIHFPIFKKIISSMLMHPNISIDLLNNESFLLQNLKYFFIYFENFFESAITKKEDDQVLFLKEIKHFRGFKHIFGYPSRGQRNHTNASTAFKVRKGLKTKN